jgi:hypothetical protein
LNLVFSCLKVCPHLTQPNIMSVALKVVPQTLQSIPVSVLTILDDLHFGQTS